MREMQQLKQWVNWDRAVMDKAPRMPSGGYAKSTDSSTWSTMDEVLESKLTGVGFVLTRDDDYIFIDLDHILAENGSFKEGCEWAADLVDELDTYWEVSPSGDGLHGYIKGKFDCKIKNKVKFGDAALEVYTEGRYSTITTNLFAMKNISIIAEYDDLSPLLKHIEVKEVVKAEIVDTVSAELADEDVIERMRAMGHWDVGTGAAGNSEVDAALIAHVSFWCGGDSLQICRVAKRNLLYRDKWDSKRGNITYLERMVSDWNGSGKAEYYTPATTTSMDVPFSDLTDVEKRKTVKKEIKEHQSNKANESIQKWLKDNSSHVWFDVATEKYCVKMPSFTHYLSKSGFQQFFLSMCGAKLKAGEINIKTMSSDYRPDKELFFSESGMEYINTFSESGLMSCDETRDDIPDKTSLLLDNLFDDKDQLKQFINWLAYIYQYRVRTGTCWVFAGKPGTGKGVLMDYIVKGIWKHNAICNLTDSHLESAFNPYMQDKMIVHFNEISADTKKSRVTVKNRLKTWMTDETIFINAKGIKEVEKSNYCNLIMNSNEHIPVDIDAYDRRFNVVRTDSVLLNTSWFVLGDTVDEIVAEIPEFVKYLNGIEVNKKLAKTVVMSELKQELVDAVKTKAEEIADAFRLKEFEYFIDSGLESWLDKQDGFGVLSLEEIEQKFSEDFITNDVISTIISAVYGREMNMMSISKTIFKRFKIGFKHTAQNKRGYLFS